ncbi:putative bifunctional diguanylate cyclase/phosphodiesterase [Actinoplanes rectilineatus]|uniref:putative bifunctional diguanylate cyclase/phosphodiesterase n=1 Tax=Actinoplanes rectilineatus TaxID=113571 RepID=UPI000697095F|nr:EAL domain-containing protein [Actinoplanes rectilineatus]
METQAGAHGRVTGRPRSAPPPRPRSTADRLTGWAVTTAGAIVAAYLVFYVSGRGGEELRTVIADGVYLPISLIFTVLVVRVVRLRRQSRRSRIAWGFIAGAYVCQLVAHTSWFVEDAVLHDAAYPSFADYWFLAFVPFMLVGLLLLPGSQRTRSDRVRLVLDALTVGASAFMVLWYLVLSPIFGTDGASLSGLLYAAALPVGDLLLVLALATLLLRPSTAVDPAVRLLAGAVSMFVVADIWYGWIQLHDGFVGGTWPDLFWVFGCYLLVLAADRRLVDAGREASSRLAHRLATDWLPYGAIAIAYGALGVIAQREGLYPLGGMIIGAVVLTALVAGRQMYALHENHRLAVTDPLTGLSNRAHLTELITRMAVQTPRDDRQGAVMLIDLDRFKPINDVYGHDAGDAVLQAVAVTLRSVIRSTDVAGRLGGDEFAVVLPYLPDRSVAERIAQRLVDALRTPVIFGEHLLSVEASVGVAYHDFDTFDAQTLLQHADIAMYAAKRSGRGRYQVYTPELDTRARDAELRQAVENGEMVVHFQPAIDLVTGGVSAVEALVRWQHPHRGMLPPHDFVDLAEETGAIVPLGTWVLREACTQAASWRAAVPELHDLRLSVNLSPRQVVQPGMLETIQTVLDETGFPADRLILELTEGVVLEPDARTVTSLEQLRAVGIRIAVDDFGTGYSALSYLRLLPVDILKIDRSFVTGIDVDPEARRVAEAVVHLGVAFGMNVVAEGIETAEHARLLTEMGCGFAQGYFFCRPVPGGELLEKLRDGAGKASFTPL